MIGKLRRQCLGLFVCEAVLLDMVDGSLVEASNGLDTTRDLLRIRAGIDSLVVFIVVVIPGLGNRGLDLVRFVRVDKPDHEVLHPGFLGRDTVRHFEQGSNGWRKMRHVPFDLVESILDALGDFDLALTGQQFDGAHLAHVHAHGIGRAPEFGIDARQRSLGFLGNVFIIGYGRIGEQYRFGIRRLFVYRDAHIVDHVDDVLDLLRIDDVIGQVIIDLGVSQETLFLTPRDQVL